MRLRVGRKVGRTIYAQQGEQPADTDPLVGVMDDPHLAEQVVEAFNFRQLTARDDPDFVLPWNRND